ncbi:hypothetical protein BH10CYA1_BH10CYA1_52910 [soil metagenome]
MPSEEPVAHKEEIRFVDRHSLDLQSVCESAAELDGEVVVAVREFPSIEYKYLYNRHQISIVRARLEMRGYSVDTKTVMDSKCSKLILIIENDTSRTMTVHAEKLRD